MGDNRLLPASTIERYNVVDTKINLDVIMNEFQWMCLKYNHIEMPRITSDYTIKYSSYVPVKSDPVGRFVERKLDSEVEIKKFFTQLYKAMSFLTKEELIWFSDKYFSSKSDTFISSKLQMTRKGLTPIKSSAIIKIALYFNEDVLI